MGRFGTQGRKPTAGWLTRASCAARVPDGALTVNRAAVQVLRRAEAGGAHVGRLHQLQCQGGAHERVFGSREVGVKHVKGALELRIAVAGLHH